MNDQSDEPFGESLRLLMRERGLTYRGLADAIGALDERGMTLRTSTCWPTATTGRRSAPWS